MTLVCEIYKFDYEIYDFRIIERSFNASAKASRQEHKFLRCL